MRTLNFLLVCALWIDWSQISLAQTSGSNSGSQGEIIVFARLHEFSILKVMK
jgi:hypothetical protein